MRWVFTAINYAGERVARVVGEDRGGVEAQVLNLHIDRIPGEPQADLVQEPWSENMGFAEGQRSGDRGVRVAAQKRPVGLPQRPAATAQRQQQHRVPAGPHPPAGRPLTGVDENILGRVSGFGRGRS